MKCIYMIKCNANNLVYIGQTNNFKRRVQEHKRCFALGVHHNKRLYQDYLKYGLDKFTFIELEYCENDIANDREDYWMEYYGGIESDSIYNYQNNITNNTDMSNRISQSNKGCIVSDEARKHLSEALMGHKLSEESKRKMSQTKSHHKEFIDVPYGNNERKYSKEFIEELRELRRQGYTFVELQNKYGICRTIISNLVHYGKSNGLKNVYK